MSNRTSPMDEPQNYDSYAENAYSNNPYSESAEAPERTQADSTTVNTVNSDRERKVKGSAAGGTWIGLIIGVLLLIVLLTFILQNQEKFDLHVFGWVLQLPIGVGMLLSAILGALIMALVGGVRILQLRRQVKRA
ncbi:LapA family protein [Corynebacterium resistens]